MYAVAVAFVAISVGIFAQPNAGVVVPAAPTAITATPAPVKIKGRADIPDMRDPATGAIPVYNSPTYSAWREKYKRKIVIIDPSVLNTNGVFTPPAVLEQPQWTLALLGGDGVVLWLYSDELISVLMNGVPMSNTQWGITKVGVNELDRLSALAEKLSSKIASAQAVLSAP